MELSFAMSQNWNFCLVCLRFSYHFASICGVCGPNDIVMTKLQRGILFMTLIGANICRCICMTLKASAPSLIGKQKHSASFSCVWLIKSHTVFSIQTQTHETLSEVSRMFYPKWLTVQHTFDISNLQAVM